MKLSKIHDLQKSWTYAFDPSLRAMLAQRERDLGNLEADCAAAWAAYAEAKKRRNICIAQIQFLRAATASVRRLPDDMLIEIFQRYGDLHHEHEGTNYETIDASRGMVLITHVCSYWRRVALATPTLWRRIRFDNTVQPGTLSALSTILKRSRGPESLEVTLDVTVISTSYDLPGEDEDTLRNLVRSNVQGFVDRIATLKIRCMSGSLRAFDCHFSRAWDAPSGPTFPRLSCLDIILEDSGASGTIFQSVVHYFQRCPMLDRLNLSGDEPREHPLTLDHKSQGPCFPWDRLRYLEFTVNVDYDLLAHVLGRSQNLEELVVDCAFVAEANTTLTLATMPKLLVPRLRRIADRENECIGLVTFLAAPALKHLELGLAALDDGSYPWAVASGELVRFQERSGFDLQMLRIRDAQGDGAAIAEFVARNQGLEELEVRSRVTEDMTILVQALTVVSPCSEQAVTAPRLRELTLGTNWLADQPVEEQLISTFLRSRLNAAGALCTPLEYVCMGHRGTTWQARGVEIAARLEGMSAA
ncbi:F-box domain-containing protein [Mycena kentingensis (nom. inval.)]|nr:F-box domain-containing protein [Mycena kentingensis (nom. inval.)]